MAAPSLRRSAPTAAAPSWRPSGEASHGEHDQTPAGMGALRQKRRTGGAGRFSRAASPVLVVAFHDVSWPAWGPGLWARAWSKSRALWPPRRLGTAGR